MADKQSTIKTIFALDGETRYKDAVKGISKEQSNLRAELNKAETAYKLNGDKVQYNKDKVEILNKQVELQKRKVDEARHALDQSSKKFGENSEETAKYKRELTYAETELMKMESQLKSTTDELKKQENQLLQTGKKLQDVGQKWQDAGKKMEQVGKNLTMKVTAPILAIGTAAFKAAMDFEHGMAKVRKTMELTDSEFNVMSDSIRELSRTIPVPVKELMGIAEAAGQLGIAKENVVSFTEIIAKLGATSNVVGDEGATSLARLANITGMSADNYERLASSLVYVGNNSATSEKEVLDMSLRLAAAATQANMTEAEIFGISAALSSLGLEAQAGGSAFSKVITRIQLAMDTGSSEINQFASIAGMSANSFAAAWRDNAAQALSKFITGLGAFDEHGQSVNQLLEILEIKELRLGDALRRTAGANELFIDSINMATDAWDKNTALQDKYNIINQTTQSQLILAKNKMNDVAIELGNKLMPTVTNVIEKISKLVEGFTKLSPKTQDSIIKFALFAAALGPVLSITGKATSAIGKITEKIGGLIAKAAGASGAGGAIPSLIGVLSNPVTGIVAAAGLAAGAIYLIVKNLNELDPSVKKAKESLKEFKNSSSESIGEMVTVFESAEHYANELFEILKDDDDPLKHERAVLAVEKLKEVMPGIQLEYNKETGAINLTREALEELIGKERERVFENVKNKIIEESLERQADNLKDQALILGKLSILKKAQYEIDETKQAALNAGISETNLRLLEVGKTYDSQTGEHIKLTEAQQGLVDEHVKNIEKWKNAVSSATDINTKNWVNTTQFMAGAKAETHKLTRSNEELAKTMDDLKAETDITIEGLNELGIQYGITSEAHNELKETTVEGNKEIAESSKEVKERQVENQKEIEKALEEEIKAREAYNKNMESSINSNLSSFSGFTEKKLDLQKASKKDLLKEWEEEALAFQNWQNNLKIIAEKVSPEVANELAKLGPAGARMVSEFVNSTDEELKELERVVALRMGIAIEASSDEMSGLFSVGYESMLNFINGLKKGEKDNIHIVKGSGKNLGNALTSSTKQTLQERSPSRIGIDIGENFAGAVGIGVKNKMGEAIDATKALSSGIIKTASLDKVKLGELYKLSINGQSIMSKKGETERISTTSNNDNSVNINVVVPSGETDDFGRRVGKAVVEQLRIIQNSRGF